MVGTETKQRRRCSVRCDIASARDRGGIGDPAVSSKQVLHLETVASWRNVKSGVVKRPYDSACQGERCAAIATLSLTVRWLIDGTLRPVAPFV